MGRLYSFLIPKYIFFPKRETVIFKAWRHDFFMKGVKYKNPSFFSCFREGKGMGRLYSSFIPKYIFSPKKETVIFWPGGMISL